jgi:hypothetical protein
VATVIAEKTAQFGEAKSRFAKCHMSQWFRESARENCSTKGNSNLGAGGRLSQKWIRGEAAP